MSSKIDQLENQPDLADRLMDFFKNIWRSKEKDNEITLNKSRNKWTTNTNVLESNKTLREKINIEIDVIQRTTVFSNNPSMWI
ncbi:MAG TPA: hypothetical protein VHH33_09260 [Nitrososphaeraceae archaeon]|jgi:hypothetical protein|nr:hypothetical protein [Nitrososphaeraceae archaeon]